MSFILTNVYKIILKELNYSKVVTKEHVIYKDKFRLVHHLYKVSAIFFDRFFKGFR
jgi:hypothetical protein